MQVADLAADRQQTRRNVAVVVAELMPLDAEDTELERTRAAAWLADVTVAVRRHGGEVRQLLGEEAVAVFGLAAAHEDDVLRALRAAMDLHDGSPHAEQRVAVESSDVIVGGAADELAEALAVSRALKEDAAPGETLLGPSALRLVSAAVDVVPHEAGRGYRVLRFDPAAPPFVRRFDAPLVGRADELRRLELALEEVAQAGLPRLIVLAGEPGIGKTRLASELAARVARQGRVLTGRCVAYGEGAAIRPLAEILEQLAPLEAVLAREPDADRIAAQLRGPELSEGSDTLWATRRLLEALARAQPVVLLLDDLNWAEPSFLDLVEYVAGWTQAPVLLVCLARPELLEARPEWRESAITLEPLAVEDVQVLAAALPHSAQLEPADVAAAVEAAEGNPLYLEQLLAFGVEGAGAVPPTVEALIASRLDRLPAGERAALDRAAVAGREFWRSAVEELTPDSQREAAGHHLMALVRRRLVRPEQAALPEEDGFRFHHALVHDVAYGAIPAPNRADLHERLARWLDRRGTGTDELVGFHLEQAALLGAGKGAASPALAQEAGERLSAAGMRALKRVDGRTAANLLTRARDLLPEPGLELELALGTAVKFTGDPARGEALLEEVAQQAGERGDRRIELRARIEQLWRELSQAKTTPEAALELLEDAVSAFEAARDEDGLGRAWHLYAAVQGEYELMLGQTEAAAVQVRDHYRRSGFTVGAALSLLAVAAHRGTTSVPEAIARCEELLLQAETPVWESFVLAPCAGLHAMAGRFSVARELLAEARAQRVEFSDAGTIVTAWAAIAAHVELLAGEPQAAEAILFSSLEVLREAGDNLWVATNSSLLAEAVYGQERYEDAVALADAALQAAPPRHLTSRAVAQRVKAMALARLGRLVEAELLASETVALLVSTDSLYEQAEAASALGDVLALKGDAEAASESWDEAIALFERKGSTVSAERVRKVLPATR